MDTNPLPNPKNAIAANVAPKRYVVTTGFNFGCTAQNPEGTRVEPGPLTAELPEKVFTKMFNRGAIVVAQEVEANG
jgi:hypothetical protein